MSNDIAGFDLQNNDYNENFGGDNICYNSTDSSASSSDYESDNNGNCTPDKTNGSDIEVDSTSDQDKVDFFDEMENDISDDEELMDEEAFTKLKNLYLSYSKDSRTKPESREQISHSNLSNPVPENPLTKYFDQEKNNRSFNKCHTNDDHKRTTST